MTQGVVAKAPHSADVSLQPLVATNGMVPTSPIYVSFKTNGNPGSGFMTDASGAQTHNVPATLPTS